MAAIVLSIVAFGCTSVTFDLITTTLAFAAMSLVVAATSTTLAPAALMSAALLGWIVAAYGVRDTFGAFQLGHWCNDEFEPLLNETNVTDDDLVDIVEFFCEDQSYLVAFNIMSALLWSAAGICVFQIPQPGNYTTLLSMVSDSSMFSQAFRGCCTSFRCWYVFHLWELQQKMDVGN